MAGAWLPLTRADSVSDELVDARTNGKGRGRPGTWSERWAFPCGVPRLWCGHRGQPGPQQASQTWDPHNSQHLGKRPTEAHRQR